MKTINTNSTGAEFIRDINDNFAECMTGGSGDGNVSINVPLQGGDLKTATGYVDGKWCQSFSRSEYQTGKWKVFGMWTDDDFYKYLHSPLYLSLKGNEVKRVVTMPSGSTLSIFCYDDTFTLLSENGVVSDVANIPTTAKYVKFQIYKSSGYSQVQALAIALASEPEWVKNTGTAYVPQWFNFDCKPPKMWDDANYTTPHQMPIDMSADADDTRYHDNGCVILPPNYSPTGKPCKVVLWFNGDNCGWFIQHDPFLGASGNLSTYDANFKYLADCGYAVVMCGGYTSMWKDEQGSGDSSFWVSRLTPAYIASVRAFYDRLMENYNFDPAFYLGAKSAGGGMLMHTAQTRPFPVRAAAGLSVGVCQFEVMRHSYIGTQKTMQKRLGCANWDSFVLSQSGSGATATLVHKGSGASADQLGDAERLLANIDIYRKTEPFTIGSDIDFEDFAEKILLLTNPFNNGADYYVSFQVEEGGQTVTKTINLEDLILSYHKVMPTPLKLWCATKDDATPFTWHKIMANWINKCGGICEMRSYTGNDGGHGTFCGDSDYTANATSPYGGTRNGVNIGVIEAVDWFNRW